MRTTLHIRTQGSGDAVLLLLHGLGATGEVWTGLTQRLQAQRWQGRVIVPDLPGHGRSAPFSQHYSFGSLAACIAQLIPPASRVVVLGHSLGGAIALTLASGEYCRAFGE